MLVVPERLDGANRRLVAAEMLVEIVSQPLGGALIGLGLALAVTVGGAGYLAGIIAPAALAGRFRPKHMEQRVLVSDGFAGPRLVWSQPVLRAITLMAGVINAC
jgi:hypothetical protein